MSLSKELANLFQGWFPQLNADQCVNFAAQLKLLIERSLARRRKFTDACMILGGKGRRLGAALRQLRIDAGLSQERATQALNWPVSRIQHIEDGAAEVCLSDLWALLSLYGIGDPILKKRLEDLARATKKCS